VPFERHGASFDDVIKFTTYLVHSQDIEGSRKFARVVPEHFQGPPYPPNPLVVDRLVRETSSVEAVARAID
jgi:enamine deaminase RidA (YjgF/YER057c/UK114 family)